MFTDSCIGMMVLSLPLIAGASVFERRLNRGWVDWLEKPPRLLTMLVGRLEDSEKLPTLLLVRSRSSVLSHQVRLSSTGLGRLTYSTRGARIVCPVSLGHQGLCVGVLVHVSKLLEGCKLFAEHCFIYTKSGPSSMHRSDIPTCWR